MLVDPDPDIIRGVVLGDLDPADIPLKVDVLWQHLPFASDVVLGLTVTKTDGGTVRAKEALPMKLLTASNLDPNEVVWQTYHRIARKMSFQLFEVDPRIGLPLTSNSMVRFPNSPLFDPPYIDSTYVRYLCSTQDVRLSAVELQVSGSLKRCPFCESAIYPFGGSRKPGVWCGGNVGFAHEECAPWVTARPLVP